MDTIYLLMFFMFLWSNDDSGLITQGSKGVALQEEASPDCQI